MRVLFGESQDFLGVDGEDNPVNNARARRFLLTATGVLLFVQYLVCFQLDNSILVFLYRIGQSMALGRLVIPQWATRKESIRCAFIVAIALLFNIPTVVIHIFAVARSPLFLDFMDYDAPVSIFHMLVADGAIFLLQTLAVRLRTDLL